MNIAGLTLNFPFVATFFSALLAFVLGMVWYHPKVLGDKWLQARGVSADKGKAMSLPFAMTFMLWLLASVFYSFMVQFNHIDTPAAFFCLSSLLWVAFAMPPTMMGAIYTSYPMQAVSIDSSYQLGGYYMFAVVHIVMNHLHLTGAASH